MTHPIQENHDQTRYGYTYYSPEQLLLCWSWAVNAQCWTCLSEHEYRSGMPDPNNPVEGQLLWEETKGDIRTFMFQDKAYVNIADKIDAPYAYTYYPLEKSLIPWSFGVDGQDLACLLAGGYKEGIPIPYFSENEFVFQKEAEGTMHTFIFHNGAYANIANIITSSLLISHYSALLAMATDSVNNGEMPSPIQVYDAREYGNNRKGLRVIWEWDSEKKYYTHNKDAYYEGMPDPNNINQPISILFAAPGCETFQSFRLDTAENVWFNRNLEDITEQLAARIYMGGKLDIHDQQKEYKRPSNRKNKKQHKKDDSNVEYGRSQPRATQKDNRQQYSCPPETPRYGSFHHYPNDRFDMFNRTYRTPYEGYESHTGDYPPPRYPGHERFTPEERRAYNSYEPATHANGFRENQAKNTSYTYGYHKTEDAPEKPEPERHLPRLTHV